MSKTKPLTVQDMREQVTSLTSIMQLVAKQQKEIVELLKDVRQSQEIMEATNGYYTDEEKD